MKKHLTEAPFMNGADLQTDWVLYCLEDIDAVQIPNKCETYILYDATNKHYYEIRIIMFTNRIEVTNLSNEHYLDGQILAKIENCLCSNITDGLTYRINIAGNGFEILFYYVEEED